MPGVVPDRSHKPDDVGPIPTPATKSNPNSRLTLEGCETRTDYNLRSDGQEVSKDGI